MTHANREDRSFWIGLAVLLLVGVFLAVPTEHGVSLALRARAGTPVAASAAASDERALLAEIDTKDQQVREALAAARDPFRDPAPAAVKAVSRPASAPPTVAARPPGRPVLRALLFDDVRPSVQLGVGGSTSDWLHRGDRFRGWQIVEINAKSVTVSTGSETVVLRSS